jgi:hypothetical protein
MPCRGGRWTYPATAAVLPFRSRTESEQWPTAARDENVMDTVEYRIISYYTLMYFSQIRDLIWVVKIQNGYRTGPGNNPDG